MCSENAASGCVYRIRVHEVGEAECFFSSRIVEAFRRVTVLLAGGPCMTGGQQNHEPKNFLVFCMWNKRKMPDGICIFR
jgi:hypothetical protein